MIEAENANPKYTAPLISLDWDHNTNLAGFYSQFSHQKS
jgi:hypothetical protein